MRLHSLPCSIVALVSFLNAGCTISTLESRIHEKNTAFARITPRQQAMIKQGLIGSGFSRDMVYMALDKPDRIVPGPGPQQETWVYLKTETSGGSPLMPVKIVTHENGGSSGGHMPGIAAWRSLAHQHLHGRIRSPILDYPDRDHPTRPSHLPLRPSCQYPNRPHLASNPRCQFLLL